jgi:glycosyltransferase involved in cell wall biosynthesis
MALVSVVITCYNKEDFIGDTILSVVNQTYEDLEIIVVNDGSKDNSLKIINTFQDSRLVIIDIQNSGENSARNIGIINSKGSYIAFLDGDDIWAPNKLFLQMKSMVSGDLNMSFCDYDTIDSSGRINNTFFKLPNYDFSVENLKNKILSGNFVLGSASSVVLKKEIISNVGLFDEELKWGGDWEFWMRIIFYTDRISLLAEKLTFLRFGIQQVQSTLNQKRRFEDSEKILTRALNSYSLSNKQKAIVYCTKIEMGYMYKLSYKYLVSNYLKAIRNDFCHLFNWNLVFLIIKYPILKILRNS